MILAIMSLWQREVRAFLRQPSRVASAVGTPLLLWGLLGSGMGDSFRPLGAASDSAYLDYFFPGAAALLLVFNSIFSAISLIQDRNGGFLQGVVVAPVGQRAIILGKVFGGASLALGQTLLFLGLAPILGIEISVAGLVTFALGSIFLALSLTGLGVLVAWPMTTVQGFHAIMNLLLMPMWMLSGAMFPLSGASSWLRSLMVVNPVTYGVTAMRQAFPGAQVAGDPDPGLSLAITATSAIVILVACVWMADRTD